MKTPAELLHRIGIGSDHHGVSLRSRLARSLRDEGFPVSEFGPSVEDPGAVDYPDIAADISRKIGSREIDRGILICGSGIGMSIVANKFPNVRAGLVWNEKAAELSRRHNDLNVLCLAGDMLDDMTIRRITTVWLNTEFDGGRHKTRLDKIRKYESDHFINAVNTQID